MQFPARLVHSVRRCSSRSRRSRTKPLNTTLDQYGPFSDVKVSPETALTTNVSVGLCLADGVEIPTVFLAHNIQHDLRSRCCLAAISSAGCVASRRRLRRRACARRSISATNGDFASATKLVGSAIADMLLPDERERDRRRRHGHDEEVQPLRRRGYEGVHDGEFAHVSNRAGGIGGHESALDAREDAGRRAGGEGERALLGDQRRRHGRGRRRAATVATGTTGVATVSNWVINAGSNTVQAVGTYADPTVTFAVNRRVRISRRR